jgi:retron-type reverse transcriptase
MDKLPVGLYRNRNLNLNARNDDLANSKSSKREDETSDGRIAQVIWDIFIKVVTIKVKSYKNLYSKLCSYRNLELAFVKARKGKGNLSYVREFEKNLADNLMQLKKELETFEYKPSSLTRFVIRDPKTRVIRKSQFKDRIVHHDIVNILEPIYEERFIHDSYANRKNKGTLAAIKRLDKFKRKVSNNGKLVRNARTNNMVKGYCLKADIKHFFNTINHDTLIKILRRNIKDNKLMWLVNLVLKNFHDREKGMPLGNMTSQFFANVYLNELDYFVKNKLKARYYIRYVDDFVILHKDKEVLRVYRDKIKKYFGYLKLELHPDKSKIFSMYHGIPFLGYKVFYNYKLLRKRNINQFKRKLLKLQSKYEKKLLDHESFLNSIEGWFAYAMWADTYRLRKRIIREINPILKNKKGS